MARLAWSRMNAMLIISGAFGVFKRSALIDVGGYSHNTVGEDMEIVVKLHRRYISQSVPYRMLYVPDPVCWTEVPNTLKILRRQRSRWQRGMLETLFKHRGMLLSKNLTAVGILGLGLFFLFDVIGPLIELFGLILVPISWMCGILNGEFFMAFLLLMSVFGVFVSVCSLLLEELSLTRTSRAQDLIVLLLAAILENFGYRQINSLWRAEGIWQFLTRKKGWGTMVRTGFQQSPTNQPPRQKL
jgi:cellulose synthase/poly-beta-1,6-N-acetylglucosamine synthase-like glycosyltransferase